MIGTESTAVNDYGLLLAGQTLLALLVLGLAGGWVLWPFRDGRPYLWLASPLAGLAVVGIALTILNYCFAVPVGWSLAVTVPALGLITLGLLARAGRRSLVPSLAGGVVLLTATAWGTLVANFTAIEAKEPTIACTGGTDQWGYAAGADWLLRHPGEVPVLTPDHLDRAPVHFMLQMEGDRPAAFLLTAAAAVLRGTSPAFSYDWLAGLALAAGVAGLAGFFATTRRGLLLLLAAGLCCQWLTISRTGFLGKLLAYPGCLLCAGVFLATWTKPSGLRIAAAAVIGLGVGLCLHPLAPLTVLVLVYGGGLAAQVAQRLVCRVRAEARVDAESLWRCGVHGVCLIVLMTGPWYAVHKLLYYPVMAVSGHGLDYQVLVALDLDSAHLPLLGVTTAFGLAAAVAALNLLLLVVAWVERDVPAQACLLASGIVPLAWLLHLKQLFLYQGLLFPLTVVGAVALLQRSAPGRRGWWLQAGVGVMAVGLIAVRAPQAYFAFDYHLVAKTHCHMTFRQSDAVALRAFTEGKSVLVASNQIYPCCLVWTEMEHASVQARYAEPSWNWLFRQWIWVCKGGLWGSVQDCIEAPSVGTVDLLVVDSSTSTSSGISCTGGNLKLLAANCDPVICCVTSPLGPTVAPDHKLMCWLNNAGAVVGLWNGTGGPTTAVVISQAAPGPDSNDSSQGTIQYQCGKVQGQQRLTSVCDWKLRLPVELAPGYNRLTLKVLEKGNRPNGLLLLLNEISLEPPAQSTRGAEELSEPSSDRRKP
jgi:hypothetical protein